MFCPVCKCEFRAGFTRCASCNADLVEDLSAATARPDAETPAAPPAVVPMADYCGFFDLGEARRAREALRREAIRADILIREASGGAGREEYWLRVEVQKFRQAAPILGYDHVEQSEDEDADAFSCSECGQRVASEEKFCPGCGTPFEEHR